ncbi:hypothetical protein CBR_g88557 [Chara braunii]|uniref:Protoporphyrinogen oxidase n=1 Tax=Chara braunii TaxID=69332 RepID=A0A388KB33_CHABU|nr:hypothetical protein CBR_g88557 [Chara braunii]|eukprot:GBG67268.1 hypothetical protein CBR_g88557 [Chara braunii]
MAGACASVWLARTGVGGAGELIERDEARHCVELHLPARSHVVGCGFAGLRPNATADGNLILTGKTTSRNRISGTHHRRRHGSHVVGNGPVHVVAERTAVATPSAARNDASGLAFDCVIVGGGISGLCTAQALATQHDSTVQRVLVTEARERVGGNITTVESDDGYLWEEGPNSFQPNVSMLRMAIDSGLKDDLVLADPDSPRFVLWDGELRPVPAGLKDLPFFDLMSPLGKIRAGLGALGIRPAPPQGKEESVEEFVRRNLGSEVFERLIEPFCSGVYAGNPEKLSMKAAFGKVWKLEQLGGSIIGGTLKLLQERKKSPPPPPDPRLPKPKGQTVGSFQKGLSTLPKAIAKSLGENKVKVNWKLKEIRRLDQNSCRYQLIYDTPDGLQTISTNTVVLTVPAYVAADLIRPLSVHSFVTPSIHPFFLELSVWSFLSV